MNILDIEDTEIQLQYLDKALGIFKPSHKKMLLNYYAKKITCKDIANKLGLSRPQCGQHRIQSMVKQLRKELNIK